MSKRKRSKANNIKIKKVDFDVNIQRNKILSEEYPVFCFKYLSEVSIKDCRRYEFFYEFLMRLKKLSELGWKEIRQSHRHGFGMEKIPVDVIRPKLPPYITPEVKYLHVFRATGENLPFVGIQVENVFRVLFIETKFGDIYKH